VWQARLTAFHVGTRDELAVRSNQGGRSVFQNVGRTRRHGLEALAQARWDSGWGVVLNASTLRATYRDDFCSGACSTGFVPAGHRLPGAPSRTAFAELSWRAPDQSWEAAVEARHVGAVFVDDRNSDAAPAYTVANARLWTQWRRGPWSLQAFVRVDNLADRRYAGSVIVNEGNRRFFEPAPVRALSAGLGAGVRW
jgi:iron complex outermembrane receptor protein